MTLFAAGPAAAPANAAGRCTAVAQIYHWDKGWYEISGGRCTDKQFKMVVSGNVYGKKIFYEPRKTCFNTKVCLELSQTFTNPPGIFDYTIAIVFGWKHHRFTMPHYRGIKKRYRF